MLARLSAQELRDSPTPRLSLSPTTASPKVEHSTNLYIPFIQAG